MALRRSDDLGDGPPCSVDADHGRTMTVNQGSWCPACGTLFAPATYDEATKSFIVGPITRTGDRKIRSV